MQTLADMLKTLDNAPSPPEGWNVVVKTSHYGSPFRSSLPAGVRSQIDRAVWAEQDGYGVRGYVPVQGWDWSGIRDSSNTAVLRMACAALRILNRHGIPLEEG